MFCSVSGILKSWPPENKVYETMIYALFTRQWFSDSNKLLLCFKPQLQVLTIVLSPLTAAILMQDGNVSYSIGMGATGQG